jgi:hypothetical protein
VTFGRAFTVLLAVAMPAGAAVMASPPPAAPAVRSLLSPILFSQPAEGSSLPEGATILIRWSGVPADAEEIELLLSVDGGRHFSLRLTDELDSSSGSFLWRVPGLSTDAASLALRMGVHGQEVMSAPGPLFRLSRGPSTPGVLLRWKAGEFWVDSRGCDETVLRSTRSPSGLSTHPERMTSVRDGCDAIDLPRSSARPMSVANDSPGCALRDADRPVSIGSPSRIPLSIPQRI